MDTEHMWTEGTCLIKSCGKSGILLGLVCAVCDVLSLWKILGQRIPL